METIFALATPPGKSGVAIIRISGPQTQNILYSLGINKLPIERYAKLHKVYHPISQELIDKSLILYFKAPASFTGEDCAELHLHGGRAIIDHIYDALNSIEDVRLAQAGEFSLRAFNNGKIDLTEAEALADLIDAETKMQHKQALRQMSGELKNLYQSWRETIIKGLSLVEAYIDFPDEDIPEEITIELNNLVKTMIGSISNHLNDNNRGEKLRSGIYVTIIGAANVGKSSLLNLLAKRDVAIVSNIAGTTRDVIEVKLDLEGYPFIISDTAGLRKTSDEIETEGIKRALDSAKNADLKIAIFDNTEEILDQNTMELIDDNTIVLFNKIDLASYKHRDITKESIPISIINNLGIDLLLSKLKAFAYENFSPSSDPVITRSRHRKHLSLSIDALLRFNKNLPIELAAEELRIAASHLGKIMGRIDVEEILDQIFSSFCIGK
jgi:tRNA modification GTPase